MSRKVDPAKLQAVFGRMMEADPENRFCADCHSKNPRWASTNLGVFICIKCAGIHRSIGTHITKVKSISLDGWEEGQLAVMRRVGNTNGRRIWEATMPENVRRERPNENASSAALDHWIRAKYERRLYFSQAAYDEVFKGAPRAAAPATAAPATTTTSTGALPPPKSIASAPRRPSGRALTSSTGTPAAAPAPTSFADSLFGAPVAAPAATPAPAPVQQPQGRPRAPSGGSAAVFGTPVAAVPQQQSQPQQRDATADILFGMGGSGSGSTAPAMTAEPRKDTSSIMALFGTSGTGAAPLQPTPAVAAPSSAAMFGGAAPLQPQQQMQQQQMQQQQTQQRPQGNYDVDLRAYGVYRATTPQQQQQMTPQMQAYYRQQQMLYQQQQQRYTPNYTRFV